MGSFLGTARKLRENFAKASPQGSFEVSIKNHVKELGGARAKTLKEHLSLAHDRFFFPSIVFDLLRRPNHMHSHLDALQAMTPVNFRRLPRDFHSVAKQASFYVAFGTDFQGFWKPKWLPNSIFEALFFDVIFQCF